MEEKIREFIQTLFPTAAIVSDELIQSLWSDYGQIRRYNLKGATVPSIIIKKISFPNTSVHPRGWNTKIAHLRKVKSYKVEVEWYKNWAKDCDEGCRIPHCYGSISEGDKHLIILEDVDALGYTERKARLSKSEIKPCLVWLANFHATFLEKIPNGLWEEGAYWHLSTRLEEWDSMEKGPLKEKAAQLDEILRNTTYRTIIHGDAKVANFCFSKDGKQVIAVDFQYVGGGCGMKDLAYLLGSCLTPEECAQFEEELLTYYFNALFLALKKSHKNLIFKQLEKEWRSLYPIAWADFTRFLLGWMPTHQKINWFSLQKVERALQLS